MRQLHRESWFLGLFGGFGLALLVSYGWASTKWSQGSVIIIGGLLVSAVGAWGFHRYPTSQASELREEES
jgi:hypothetical protein